MDIYDAANAVSDESKLGDDDKESGRGDEDQKKTSHDNRHDWDTSDCKAVPLGF